MICENMDNKNNKGRLSDLTFACAVSVYNGEATITRCVESILGQSRHFDKIIVYNDASTDHTIERLHELRAKDPRRICVIDSEINRGPGGGKNYLAENVDTDYFMFVDADDYIDEDYLASMIAALNSFYEKRGEWADIVISDFKGVDLDGKVCYRRSFRSGRQSLYAGISNWGKLFKKMFWDEHHLKIPAGKVLEDVLLRAYIVGCVPIVVHTGKTAGYNYTNNPNSVSNTYMNRFIEGIAKREMEYLYRQMRFIQSDKKEEYLYWIYKIYCWHMLKSGSAVGIREMRREDIYMKCVLARYFHEYKSNSYLMGKKSLRYERPIVRLVVRAMWWLEKIHMQKLFLYLYAIVDLRWLWPKM